MTDFNSLLNKSKAAQVQPISPTPPAPKPNPFAALNKTVATAKAKQQPQPAKLEPELQQPTTITADEFNSPDQPDTIDATAVEGLKSHLQTLQNSFTHKELVADAIRGVLIHVKKHPFLKDILLPEDCQTMVRALRESYGVQIVTKQRKQTKRSATQAEVDEAAKILDDLGF